MTVLTIPKSPSPLRRHPVRLLKVLRIVQHLPLIQPLERLPHTLPILLQLRQPRLHARLRDKRNIPQLAPIRPAYPHPLGPQPHKVVPLDLVLLPRLARGTLAVEARDEVEHLVHGGEGLVGRVLVLHDDELVGAVDAGVEERREGALAVGGEDDVDEVVDGGMWGVEVDGGDVVPLCGPVDFVVVLGV